VTRRASALTTSNRGCGCDRKLAGDRRRYDRFPDRAERDVCPPLARWGDAFDRSDDGAARDDQSQIVAEWRNQFLDEPAVRTEPPPAREMFEAALELVAVAAEADVTAPAAEPRLDHKGKGAAVDGLFPGGEWPRLRMGQTGAAERAGGDELVVRRD
jgi:hypothetical protein